MRRHHVFVTGYSTGGAIALVLGAAHFFLPSWGYDRLVLQSIPEIPRDHFVYLATYAIGLFLVSVGVMSFHFAKVGGSQTAKLFAALQAASGRRASCLKCYILRICRSSSLVIHRLLSARSAQ